MCMILVSQRQSEKDGSSSISTESRVRCGFLSSNFTFFPPHWENKKQDSAGRKETLWDFTLVSASTASFTLVFHAEPFFSPIFSFIILPVLTIPRFVLFSYSLCANSTIVPLFISILRLFLCFLISSLSFTALDQASQFSCKAWNKLPSILTWTNMLDWKYQGWRI